MKFYLDTSHYIDRKDWVNVPHVIRPYFVDGDKKVEDCFLELLAGSHAEGDFTILPMNLEYYYIRNKKDQMESYITEAHKVGKKVIAFNDGDNGVRCKLGSDVIVLCQNAYQSKRKPNEYGNSFIVEEDPMKEFFNCDDIAIRDKGEKPRVGFDGFGKESVVKVLYHSFRNIIDNIKYSFGLSFYIPNKVIPATLIRTKALDILEEDNRIEANFKIRNQFRAGAKTAEEQRQKSLEFFTNMLDSDYVLCARGVGNFSKRFYETLAMGRIPVFINTDCVLPFDNIIDWKKVCVWIEEQDIDSIAEKLCEFHASISNEDFKELQRTCRRVWENHLSRRGVLESMGSLI